MINLSYFSHDSFDGYYCPINAQVQFTANGRLMMMYANAKGITGIRFLDSPEPFVTFVGRRIAPVHRKEIENRIEMSVAEFDPVENMQRAIDYLNGEEVEGDIHLYSMCSDFQYAVYKALLDIPLGTTVHYKDIAEAIGKPTATRAVATAIGNNTIAVLIPCHRVVPVAGGYGRYRWGAALKRSLIAEERRRAKKSASRRQ